MKTHYITKDGNQLGPYTIEEIVEKIAAGEFTEDDLCWTQGMTEWESISTVLSSGSSMPPPPPVVQERHPEPNPEIGSPHTFAERLRDGNKAAQEGAKFIKDGAMVGWAGLKRHTKQAALRAEIEKLRNIDLRKAFHSLGKKAFEQGVVADGVAEQFQAIRDLDARIAEMRDKPAVDVGEKKMATLKRLGKDVVHSSQAQAMLLKRQGLLTELGKTAYLLEESESISGIVAEKDNVKGIEAQIRMIEETIAEQMDVVPPTSSVVSKDSPSKSNSSQRGTGPTVFNSGGISAVFRKVRNLVSRKIVIASCAIIVGVMFVSFLMKSDPGGHPEVDDFEARAPAVLEKYKEGMRSNDGKPCRICKGSGQGRPTSCSTCIGRGTVKTPSGYVMACPKCEGTGKGHDACNACSGSGVFRSPY